MEDVQIFEDALRQALYGPATEALNEIGTLETDTIRADISIPVERDFAGNVIVRSSPGEAPRLETGLLQEGISFNVDQEADGPVLNIISARDGDEKPLDVPQQLEDMNRPYMTPAVARLESYATEVMADHYART